MGNGFEVTILPLKCNRELNKFNSMTNTVKESGMERITFENKHLLCASSENHLGYLEK